jgi:hypothetical protein
MRVVVHRPTPELVSLLRITLQDVQESIWKDSPSIQELKRAILRAIADLESEKKGPHRLRIVPKRQGSQSPNDK